MFFPWGGEPLHLSHWPKPVQWANLKSRWGEVTLPSLRPRQRRGFVSHHREEKYPAQNSIYHASQFHRRNLESLNYGPKEARRGNNCVMLLQPSYHRSGGTDRAAEAQGDSAAGALGPERQFSIQTADRGTTLLGPVGRHKSSQTVG